MDKEIITRVLEGNCSPEDRKELIQWIQESENNRKEFQHLESLWNAIDINVNPHKFDGDDAFQKFLNKSQQAKKTFNIRLITEKRLFRIAVAAILFAILGISISNYYTATKNLSKVEYFSLITPKGSKSELTLPDGTQIWLNAGSKLRYPNKFNKNVREVFLEGEGYFDVKKDIKRPFIVKTSDINIKVLGTVFNVKSYPEEGTIETTLVSGSVIIEGKIGIGKPRDLIKLSPNQRATFIKKVGKLILSDSEKKQLDLVVKKPRTSLHQSENIILTNLVNTEVYTSWKNNRLIFDNEPFESIALKLERRFGATIVFTNDKIKNFRYSGRFDKISIEEALEAMKYASQFNYVIQKDTILIGE